MATGGWALLTSGSKSFNIPALTGAYGFISDDASREAYFQQLKARDGLSSPAVLAVAARGRLSPRRTLVGFPARLSAG